MYHLSRELIQAYRDGKFSSRDFSKLLAEHLVTLCPTCTHEMHLTGSASAVREPRSEFPGTSSEDSRQARQWLEELRREPDLDWTAKVARARTRFRGLAFAEVMLNEARQVSEKALEAATCAQVALLQPGVDAPHIHALAIALQMNAYRIQGEYARAQQHLDLMPTLMRRVTSPACQAEVASLTGSLLFDLRQFVQARAHLSLAELLYKHVLHDRALAAQVTIQIAGICYSQRQWGAALETLLPALQDLDEEEAPRVYGILRYNLALLFCAMDHPDAALELLPEVTGLLREYGTALDQQALLWLEGRIRGGLRQHHEAYRLLTTLQRQYRQEGRDFCAALVACDICCLHLDRLEVDTAAEALQPALTTMRRYKLHREVEQIVLGLQKALVGGALTIRALRSALPKLEHAARARMCP